MTNRNFQNRPAREGRILNQDREETPLDDAEDQNQRQNKTEGKLAFCGAAPSHLFRPISRWRLWYCNEASTTEERVSRIEPLPETQKGNRNVSEDDLYMYMVMVTPDAR